jgi:hypothetical protein
MENAASIKEQVREHYAGQAQRVRRDSAKATCCGGGSGCCGDPITSNLYQEDERAGLPAEALAASLAAEIRPLWLS